MSLTHVSGAIASVQTFTIYGTRNLSADNIAERYHLYHAVVVKFYHPYTQFPHNVRLSRQQIATFSAHRDFFDYCAL